MAGRQREAAMCAFPRLGPANFALTSLYFAPVWGVDAVRALKSPFSGFEDRVHSAAANYLQHVFDLGLDGLVRTSNLLAGIKLVAAAGLVAYVIEFARSVVIGREVDRATLNAVLALAVISIALWAVPALALRDAGLIQLYATQILLVTGALIVIMVERQIEQSAALPASRATAAERERDSQLWASTEHVTSDAAGATLRPAA
jgi:hypothetical protein